MISQFFGLRLASQALSAHQLAMQTTSHNIANANTKGFSRQVVNYSASMPLPPIFNGTKSLQFGTGVEISDINRVRNLFLDNQMRTQNSINGYYQSKSELLTQLEEILLEPSDTGLSTTMNRFFNALQELTTNPESSSLRNNLRNQAETLTLAFREAASRIGSAQTDLNSMVSETVIEVNSLTRQIAALNVEVYQASMLGSNPNDLMDKRDLLIEELSKLTNVQTVVSTGNQTNIFVFGKALVRDGESTDLVAQQEAASTALDGVTKLVAVKWSDDLADFNVSSGKLKGILDSRDISLVSYSQKLDTMVSSIVTEFNAQHQAGFGLDGSTGLDFFDPAGLTALTFSVSSDVKTDINKIAAGSAGGGPGDASNAILMAQLKYQVAHLDPNMNDATYDDYYNNLIGSLGSESSESHRIGENQEFLIQQLDERRQSVSGVSLDEEMVNLISYQKSYEAAARVVTAIDQMLDTLINSMGIVGR